MLSSKLVKDPVGADIDDGAQGFHASGQGLGRDIRPKAEDTKMVRRLQERPGHVLKVMSLAAYAAHVAASESLQPTSPSQQMMIYFASF